jgi:predicted Ser/Thr protein kinase
MAEFASKGVAGSGLGLGIAGTALGLLNNGGIGGILGGGYGGMYGMYGCSENVPATRYDLEKEQKIAELQQKLSLTESSIYTDGKLNDLRNYIDRRFNSVEAQICQQNVYNATNTATLNCMAGQIAQLMSLTKTVIPNTNVCPGWGDVTVSVTPATAAAGA